LGKLHRYRCCAESLAGFFRQPMKKCGVLTRLRGRYGRNRGVLPSFRLRKTHRTISRQADPCGPQSEARGHAFRRTVHPPRMPLSTRRRCTQRRPCNQGPFASIITSVICRKSWLLVVTLISATLGVCGLSVSGCSFGDQDNVGAVGDAAVVPASTPQIPESMKTNDFGNGPQGPPQGL
jgi:hypothetical protein